MKQKEKNTNLARSEILNSENINKC